MDFRNTLDKFIEFIENPASAAVSIFALLLLLSILKVTWWGTLVTLTIVYLAADSIVSFSVELGEDYGKIFPYIDAEFDNYGHVFFTYFLAVIFATWLSNKIGLFVESRFLAGIADMQAKAMISGLVIIMMGFDTFVRKL